MILLGQKYAALQYFRTKIYLCFNSGKKSHVCFDLEMWKQRFWDFCCHNIRKFGHSSNNCHNVNWNKYYFHGYPEKTHKHKGGMVLSQNSNICMQNMYLLTVHDLPWYFMFSNYFLWYKCKVITIFTCTLADSVHALRNNAEFFLCSQLPFSCQLVSIFRYILFHCSKIDWSLWLF